MKTTSDTVRDETEASARSSGSLWRSTSSSVQGGGTMTKRIGCASRWSTSGKPCHWIVAPSSTTSLATSSCSLATRCSNSATTRPDRRRRSRTPGTARTGSPYSRSSAAANFAPESPTTAHLVLGLRRKRVAATMRAQCWRELGFREGASCCRACSLAEDVEFLPGRPRDDGKTSNSAKSQLIRQAEALRAENGIDSVEIACSRSCVRPGCGGVGALVAPERPCPPRSEELTARSALMLARALGRLGSCCQIHRGPGKLDRVGEFTQSSFYREAGAGARETHCRRSNRRSGGRSIGWPARSDEGVRTWMMHAELLYADQNLTRRSAEEQELYNSRARADAHARATLGISLQSQRCTVRGLHREPARWRLTWAWFACSAMALAPIEHFRRSEEACPGVVRPVRDRWPLLRALFLANTRQAMDGSAVEDL